MPKEAKKANIANFNIVFNSKDGEVKNSPMIEYFNEIVYPALKQEKIISNNNDLNYLLMDVKLIELKDENLALCGIIVKDTILEIKSKLIEGELENTDESYETSPYSIFCIYLKNHRMILVRNQKGSPDLKSFSSVIKKLINSYIHENNGLRKKKKEKLLPKADINVVGIPIKGSLKSQINKIEKISKLKMNFYRLNSDTDMSEINNFFRKNFLNDLESETGNIEANSPKNRDKIVELVESSEGMAKTTVTGFLSGNRPIKISNNKLSEITNISIDSGKSITEQIKHVGKIGMTIENVMLTGDENKKSYEKYKPKLKELVFRK